MMTGCASWFFGNETEERALAMDEDIRTRIENNRENFRESRPFMASKAWLGGDMVFEPVRHDRLENEHVKFAMNGVTLPEIAVKLSELTNLTVKMNSDLSEKPRTGGDGSSSNNKEKQQQNSESSTDATGQTVQVSSGNPLSPLALFGQGGSGMQKREYNPVGNPLETETNVSVDGSVRTALDLVSSKFGISWRYDEVSNTIEFFRVETRSFQVFFPGGSTQEVTVGKSSGEDQVIEQETEFQNSGGNWEEIESGINSILSPYGRATVLQSTGSVVVSDTPQNLRFVGEYVEKINEVFGRQVYLEFRVVRVSMRDNNEFQATWAGIIENIQGGESQLTLDSAGNLLSSAANQFNIIRTNNGASLALDLLATKANLSEVTTHSVTTLSNQPAPIRVVTDTSYISGVNQESGYSNSETIISQVETSSVDTGFSVTLTPRVQNAERLQLQIAMEISNLLELKSFDDTLIQTPTLDRRALVQRAWLNTGQTLVMSGFMSDRESENLSGSGDAGFWGLGGGRQNNKDQQVLMVLITPYIQSGAYSG